MLGRSDVVAVEFIMSVRVSVKLNRIITKFLHSCLSLIEKRSSFDSPFFGIILRPLQGSTFGALFYINFTLHSLCCKNTGCVFLH